MQKLNNILERAIRKLLRQFFKRMIVSNLVIFESIDKRDNGWVLFNYVYNNRKDLNPYFYSRGQYIDKCSYPDISPKFNIFPNDGFFVRINKIWHIERIKNSASTVFITQLVDIRSQNKKTHNVYVGHGFGLKRIDSFYKYVIEKGVEFMVPSLNYYNAMKLHYNFSHNKIIIAGQPRLDLLTEDATIRQWFYDLINIRYGEKIIFVLPTFRYKNNKPDFNQIMPNYIDYDRLNKFLETNNMKLVIKPHPIFDKSNNLCFNKNSRIIWLKDSLLTENETEITSLLVFADAFITDYSTIASDILLLNKPIGFFVDDLTYYTDETQALLVDNPLDYMPGEHIFNEKDLFDFLYHCKNGVDYYKNKREILSLFFNGFTTPPLTCSKQLINIYHPLNNR